jgi:hypothetical protein
MMTYQITDENGMNININEIEDEKEVTRMNEIVWTPELDRQLFQDLEEYVLDTNDIGGFFLLCQKYNCTLGAIEKRIEEVHARSLVELDTHWREFNAHRLTGAGDLGALPEGVTAIRLSNVVCQGNE